MSAANNSEQQALQERQKFVSAFNDTIIRIWQEQITLLGVINTGALLASPKAFRKRQRRRWFSRKYYASVMNLNEFYESYIEKLFIAIISNVLNKNFGRNGGFKKIVVALYLK